MDHVQGDLSIDAMIGFEDVVAALPVYDTNMDYKINETIFFGERGRMTLRKMTGLEIEIAGVASTPEFSGSHELDYGKERVFGEPRSFLIAPLQHIIDCLDGKDEPVSTGEDELKTLAILSALQQSAQQDGKRIYL
jgi:predicted dehydrogenase